MFCIFATIPNIKLSTMKNIFLALVGALASFTSCNNQYVTTVDADQFEQMMKSQKIQIIDARTAEEYADGFIPTAVKDRKSTRLNSSHANISYAVFCLKKNNLPALPPLHG